MRESPAVMLRREQSAARPRPRIRTRDPAIVEVTLGEMSKTENCTVMAGTLQQMVSNIWCYYKSILLDLKYINLSEITDRFFQKVSRIQKYKKQLMS